MDVGVATPDIIFSANTPSASSLPLCQTCASVKEGREQQNQNVHFFKISVSLSESSALVQFSVVCLQNTK